MIEVDLYTHLVENVPVLGGRIYPIAMPQSCEKPAMVYGVTNEKDNQKLGGFVLNTTISFQFDIYGKSYFDLKQIKDEVKTALYGFKPLPQNIAVSDDYEDETKLYVQILEFNLTV